MISIRTTAEFDSDGRFTGHLTEPISPGVHSVDVMIQDQIDQEDQPTSQPQLEWEGSVLVWTGPLRPDIDQAAREIIDERERRIVEGPWE